MKLRIQQVDLNNLSDVEKSNIDQVLKESDGASIFHTVEWNQLLIDWFDLEFVTLLAFAGSNPVGLYIFQQKDCRVCWSPVIDLQSVYGGPIAVNDNPAVMKKLLKESEKTCPASYFNIWSPPHVKPGPFERQDYEVEEMLTGVMRLDWGKDKTWKQIDRKKRTRIRKAVRKGAYVKQGNVENLELYRDMVAETLAGSGIEPMPLGFYQLLFERLRPTGLAKLFFVHYDKEIISGTIVLYYKDTIYGWDVGWRRKFSSISPNDLLVWETATRGIPDGYKYFDFLRVEPDRLPGIAQWKMQFGLEILPVYGFTKETFGFRLHKAGDMLLNTPSKAFKKFNSYLKDHLAFN